MILLKNLNKYNFRLFIRLFEYIKPYKVKFFLTFLIIISGIIVNLFQPLVWAKVISNMFAEKYNYVKINILFTLIIYVLQNFISFTQSYLITFLNNNMVFSLRNQMYKKMLNFKISMFNEMGAGDIMCRISQDTLLIGNTITNQFLNILIDIFKIIAIGIIVFKINFLLALITILLFPFSYLIVSKCSKILRKENRELAELNDKYLNYINESVAGIKEIRSLGIKSNRISLFSKLSKNLKDKAIKLSLISNISQILSQSISFISQIITISVGAYLIFKKSLSIEYFIAFSSYSNQFTTSLTNITKLNLNIQQVLISLERISMFIDKTSEKLKHCDYNNLKYINGYIRFSNVSFCYDDSIDVLKQISFNIEPNKKNVIVGKSGSGKTTIFNLLMGFYKPNDGNILIDNIDINKINEDSLTSIISAVRQDTFLFNMSIKDNLLLVNSAATDEEIYEVCKKAEIHSYIDSLPSKYNSIVGENGINFSAGQKQRISIARALLKKSKIILLDEATSSLDSESQYSIRKVIDEISKNHTIIMIAHRFSTIVKADNIIVIDDGQVVANGTHEFLMNASVIYRKLYEAEVSCFNETRDICKVEV